MRKCTSSALRAEMKEDVTGMDGPGMYGQGPASYPERGITENPAMEG